MIGIETEKGGMIIEKDTDPPQEAGVNRLLRPAKFPIHPFVVEEVMMVGTLRRTDGQPTKSRGLESKKQEEALNILQDKL